VKAPPCAIVCQTGSLCPLLRQAHQWPPAVLRLRHRRAGLWGSLLSRQCVFERRRKRKGYAGSENHPHHRKSPPFNDRPSTAAACSAAAQPEPLPLPQLSTGRRPSTRPCPPPASWVVVQIGGASVLLEVRNNNAQRERSVAWRSRDDLEGPKAPR